MGKKNKSGRRQPGTNTSAVTTSTSNSVSTEDKGLLEYAKSLVEEGDKELKGLIQKLAEKANEEHMLELEAIKEDFVKNLEKEHSDKVKEIETLNDEIKKLEEKRESENDAIEQEKVELEKDRKKLENDRNNFELDCRKKGKEKVDSIFKEEKAKFEDDQKNLEKELADVAKQRKQLDDEKAAFNEEMASERKKLDKEKKEFEEDKEETKESFERRDNRLKIKEEEYNKSNPAKIAEQESIISNLEESLASWEEAYRKLSVQKNELELTKARMEGYSIEELQQERDRLSEKLDELQNKFSDYTDLKLSEMKLALEEKPKYINQINQLQSEVASKEHELSRRANVQLEYEQLKEQLGLLRSLNDHLRTELSTTKKMLESSTSDVCPALTQIDTNIDSDKENDVKKNRDKLMSQSETLNSIVKHIKEYAASRAKPLFYTEEDIKAFIAGMAASSFAILQGMSGTGKTSLPRIFADAIFGEVKIVPVESSWRDRNELLGYYNDFSKKFTAKEFTCDLYKANTPNYRSVPYFIVLDEMNLSRVEYYFADFLSVLENDPKDWKVQLVETDMRQLPNEITPEVREALSQDDSARYVELRAIVEKLYPEHGSLDSDAIQNAQAGEKQKLLQFLEEKHFKNIHGSASLVTGPQLLEDGKIITIPENVWFIGTANKDESTFEITDKVYDRAQVMNFRNRAKGQKVTQNIEKRFISYETLKRLFNTAKKEFEFDCASNPAINDIDNYLKEHFKVSFGNRILDQINKFVPVYVAASFVSKPQNEEEANTFIYEALDYQITNKVLRKLEYIDMAGEEIEELEEIFKKYKFKLALDFLSSKKEN
ncbi:MAG: hypothetical protein IKW26_00975 [Treponema sp.]|nr:hypothetical protein [Treponema sp.]